MEKKDLNEYICRYRQEHFSDFINVLGFKREMP